jgi:hypothetical protein
MDVVLARALKPVLLDLRRTGMDLPGFRDQGLSDADSAAVNLVSPDGSESSLRVGYLGSEAERVAQAADQVQEWAIEELWPRLPTNWPPCPHHPAGHPLQASAVDGVAVWMCPVDAVLFAPVGAL